MMLFALAATLTGCVPKSEHDALVEKVAKLEEKVNAMGSGARPGAPGAPGAAAVDPAQEEAASKLLSEIQEARKAGDTTAAKAKLSELTAKYGDTRAGKAAARIGPEVNLIGTDAKPIEVEKWFTKKKATFDDSKTTVLVFWESWCPHCKREVPKLPELAGKWKGKGVQVVALTKVTKSSTDEIVETFIKENKLESIPVGKEKEGSMSAAYAVTGIPAAAVVKGGKVIWRGHPAQLTDDVIGKLTEG